MAYQLTFNGVIRLADRAFIPESLNNRDWRRYLAWIAEGNVPTPADPPPPPTRDELDAAEARQYAKLAALRDMTPAQVSAWVDANITDLSSARDALKTLAIAVGVLARKL